MDANELKSRTNKFAHDCVELALLLPKNYLGHHIRGQLMRSSTSVACNYRAVCLAHSKSSFISKVSIVIEEIDESNYWLNFIKDRKMLNNQKLEILINESKQLTSIFIKSRKTARKSLNIDC